MSSRTTNNEHDTTNTIRGSTAAETHLNVLEHERVVANLPQLHDGVHQGLGSTFALRITERITARELPNGLQLVNYGTDYSSWITERITARELPNGLQLVNYGTDYSSWITERITAREWQGRAWHRRMRRISREWPTATPARALTRLANERARRLQ